MENLYAIPEIAKAKFSDQEIDMLLDAYKALDTDGSGKVSRTELVSLTVNDAEAESISKILKELDLDGDGELSFGEFILLILNQQDEHSAEGSSSLLSNAGKEVVEKVSGSNVKHSYKVEERECFARVINQSLAEDEHCKDILPVDPDTEEIFKAVDNGIIFCKLVNIAVEGTIDERVLNIKDDLNIFQIKENLSLAISSIAGIGLKVIGIDAELIMKHSENLILGLLWQLIRVILVKDINLKHVPELARLLDEENDEELADLLKLPPQEILIRWINYHLKNAGSDRKVEKIGKPMEDSIVYATLLHQLDSSCIDPKAVEEESDLKKRAKMVLDASTKFGISPLISPTDIVQGNPKLNTVFVADIFNHKHGLEELTQEEYEAAALLDDDIEGSREERAYRMWANSLGIEDLYVNNLYEEAKDGLLLLKVMDRVQPGIVNWKLVEKKAGTNRIKRQINCQRAIETARDMKLKVVGIDSHNIVEGNKKLILAIVWQVVRVHYLQLIGTDSETDLVKWANSLVKEESQVKSLRDKSIKSGKFLIEICAGIEPRAINWDIVTDGETKEDRESNAKYAISIARKLGAIIFCIWDDIVKVNHKMILVFVCALKDVASKSKKGKEEEKKDEE
ncbi:unnamed protein product [Moneuplotes crassus]|uniref:Calmodulin n=1 Tax=Euplotes crassus TaxID=5936 RepID=A0AAD1U7P7_EUPCR|nr:unnamed protein product [Moneuplotes crassus]